MPKRLSKSAKVFSHLITYVFHTDVLQQIYSLRGEKHYRHIISFVELSVRVLACVLASFKPYKLVFMLASSNFVAGCLCHTISCRPLSYLSLVIRLNLSN